MACCSGCLGVVSIVLVVEGSEYFLRRIRTSISHRASSVVETRPHHVVPPKHMRAKLQGVRANNVNLAAPMSATPQPNPDAQPQPASKTPRVQQSSQ